MANPTTRLTTHGRRRRPLILLQLQHDQSSVEGIAEQADRHGWRLLDMILVDSGIPTNPPPQGAIISSTAHHPPGNVLVEMGCPAVRLGGVPFQTDDHIPAVLPDLRMAGHLAADHFAERSFLEVAYIGSFPWAGAKGLYEGLAERANELDLNSHVMQVKLATRYRTWETKTRAKYEIIQNWIKTLPTPVGILCYSDYMAARICLCCEEIGLRVPEDVALLSIGNNRFTCEFAPIPISAIDTNKEELARQAALLLQRMMDGEDVPVAAYYVPPKRIVTRQSTDVLAVKNAMVSEAIQFIWDRMDEQISVDDVAEAMCVSRSTLERAFRRELDRGVNAEMRRKRLEACCELLRSTDMTIAEIATNVGFRSKGYLHRAFQQSFGITPKQYRTRRRTEEGAVSPRQSE